MSDNDGRSILHYQLSELLGFDDGVADVVDHLLSIESSQVSPDVLGELISLFINYLTGLFSVTVGFARLFGATARFFQGYSTLCRKRNSLSTGRNSNGC